MAAVTLTSHRLVYDIRKFTEGDMSWIIVGGATGLALTAISAARASARRSGRTAAGQIRHENLANLITGANARTTFAGPATVTATLIEPPTRVIRLHLVVNGTAEEIARRWIQAAATERLQRLAGSLNEHPGKRDELLDAAARSEGAQRLLGSALGSSTDMHAGPRSADGLTPAAAALLPEMGPRAPRWNVSTRLPPPSSRRGFS